jgi:hypothetical protein
MVDEKMVAAITHSDNIAAEEIWTRLGNAATAATDVESELRAAGDPTVVPAERQRPQYSAFGQAEWALDNQVKFMSYIACDPFADPVSALMGQIADDQRWGLGAIPAARFKGGWGPAPDGAYLVRQMGLIPTPSGLSAVAVAVQPDSGQFDDGVAYLTEIARWLSEHSALLPAGRCP